MGFESLLEIARDGDPESQYKIGIAYCLDQEGVGVNYVKAAEWFQLAADQGFLPAKRELGIMYLTGDGVEIDPAKAYKLLSDAAQALDPNAMYHLALMYEKGIGINIDLYEAIKLLAYAATAGYPGAEQDAERVDEMISKKRISDLRSRPLLNLEMSDVDVMAACCKPMLDAMMDETIVVMDTFGGPQLIGEDEDGNDLPLNRCPFCGKPVKRVPRDKEY